MNSFDKKFISFEKMVIIFISIVFALTIGSWVAVAYIASKGIEVVSEQGLKQTIDRVWEGAKK